MVVEFQTKPKVRLDQITSGSVEEYGNFVQILESAAERMAGLTSHQTLNTYLREIVPSPLEGHGYNHYVFLTDSSKKLPYPATVYHVTGGTALNALQKGRQLLPTDAHFLSGIVTDKGILVHLVSAFMETLGVPLGNLQQFLFSGPQIDAEQVAHFNNMSGLDINKLGIEIFLKLNEGQYVLADDLNIILSALDQGVRPIDSNYLKPVVDRFVERMYTIPNIRDCWIDEIGNILYGLKPFLKEGIDYSIREWVEQSLELEMIRYRDSGFSEVGVVPQPAVVLEINTRRLIEAISVDGLFLFSVGNGPFETIFSSLTIVPKAVQAAYIDPEFNEKIPTGNIPIKSLDGITDGSKWLRGVNWRDANLNTGNPLCAIRHSQREQTTWWKIANSGLIAPAKTILQNALHVPPMVLTTVFSGKHFDFLKSRAFQAFPEPFERQIGKRFGHIKGVFNIN